MVNLRTWLARGILGVLVGAGSVISLAAHGETLVEDGSVGASYLVTVKDINGNFSSRAVLVLHADHTMSVTDSGQGGPTFFSSPLGSWKPNGTGGIVGRTIDFDYPPNADVARIDHAISFGIGGSVTGTVTITVFPLQGNPLDGGGTVIGQFTFVGQLIQP